MKTKTIKQSVFIRASPQEVYESLADSRKHSMLIGEPARVSRKVGGKFSVFGRYATGKNLKLVRYRRIVQTWRASDWPRGHFSTVSFELKRAPGGTKLTFVQKNVPEEFFKDISQGWKEFYWANMKAMLE